MGVLSPLLSPAALLSPLAESSRGRTPSQALVERERGEKERARCEWQDTHARGLRGATTPTAGPAHSALDALCGGNPKP